jgi:hypothetical protein
MKSTMDIPLCLEQLGLSTTNEWRLNQSIPPHRITEWKGDDPQPTEELLQQVWADGALDRAIVDLREKRNRLLAETDWWVLPDRTSTQAQKDYRQALRDITAGLDTVDKVNAVTWPEKPE